MIMQESRTLRFDNMAPDVAGLADSFELLLDRQKNTATRTTPTKRMTIYLLSIQEYSLQFRPIYCNGHGMASANITGKGCRRYLPR